MLRRYNSTSKSDLGKMVFTKRSMLSLLGSQYDPLGLASPFIAKLKIFMSKLFKNHADLGLDDPLNDEEQKTALKITQEMIYASEHPLLFKRANKPQGYRLKMIIAYSDGSTVAIQTVLYGVYENKDNPNEKKYCLLTAKNNIANQTVPRNELNSLLASHRLVMNYFEAVDEAKNVEEIKFLSDSTCCLESN